MHNRRLLVFLAFGLSALMADVAFAQEQQCSSRYRFEWGQQVPGTLATKAGSACRIPFITHGNATITGVRIVQAPRNGRASVVGAAIRFQPRAGFAGQDSMIVRYSGTGALNKPREATVTFAITVY